ncbi:MAG: 50S ribosomal protein L15 [Thermoguttaceae bacterium]
MNINDVHFESIPSKKARRVGRGTGSGRGKTSQRGHKGQGSRSGSSMSPVFEGGQMPLARRIPKRGFNNKRFSEVIVCVNIGDMEVVFEQGGIITPDILREKGLIKKAFDQLKILAHGEITQKFDVTAHAFSASAVKKIEAAGGKVTLLPSKKLVVKNKMGTRKKQFAAKS